MPENKPEKSSRTRRYIRRSWRVTKWFTFIVVVLGIGYIVITNIRGQRAADQMLKELASRGIPAEAPESPPEHENASRFYHAAAELFTDDPKLFNIMPVNGMADWPLFGEGFSQEQADLLQQVITENELAFQSLRRVDPNDTVDFDLDPTNEDYTYLKILGESRRIARWLKLDSYQASSVNDTDRAVADCLAVLLLADHLTQEHYSIISLVRIGHLGLCKGAIEDLLSRAELTDQQLVAIANAIRDNRFQLDYAPVLMSELNTLPKSLKYPQWHTARDDYSSWQITVAILNDPTSKYTFISGMFDQLFDAHDSYWKRFKHTVGRTFTLWCPGQSQLNTAAQAEQYLEIYDELNQPNLSPQQLLQLIEQDTTYPAISSMQVTLRAHMQMRATLAATEAALEVERFRLREGRWPKDLNEVYDETPTCDYGHELKMIVLKDKVRVYSIGANGIDDSGIGEDDYDDYDPNDPRWQNHDPDDSRFVLLNPDQRNRPATTPLVNPNHVWDIDTDEYEMDWSEEDGDQDLDALNSKSEEEEPDASP